HGKLCLAEIRTGGYEQISATVAVDILVHLAQAAGFSGSIVATQDDDAGENLHGLLLGEFCVGARSLRVLEIPALIKLLKQIGGGGIEIAVEDAQLHLTYGSFGFRAFDDG